MKEVSNETLLRREVKALKHEIAVLQAEKEYELRLKNQAFFFINYARLPLTFEKYCNRKKNRIEKPPLVRY